jgi:hypothetical protein
MHEEEWDPCEIPLNHLENLTKHLRVGRTNTSSMHILVKWSLTRSELCFTPLWMTIWLPVYLQLAFISWITLCVDHEALFWGEKAHIPHWPEDEVPALLFSTQGCISCSDSLLCQQKKLFAGFKIRPSKVMMNKTWLIRLVSRAWRCKRQVL